MEKRGYVYFMSNRERGVIYIGVTSDMVKRVYQHREGMIEGFTQKYRLKNLVYYEIFNDISTAIIYEKKLKNVRREKKIEIIERSNPNWNDLYHTIIH